jgi:hypothetical protein
MKSVSVLAFALALAPAAPLAGQAVAAPAEMGKLDFLAGEWRGEGWALTQAGRETFSQRERVLKLVDGHVLVIEGLGKAVGPEQSEGATVHQAFAVVSYEPAARIYRMRTFRAADGQWREHELTVRDRGFVWGFPTPQGQVRFTMDITAAGQWHEIGEFSADGATWRQFLEFTLSKQP